MFERSPSYPDIILIGSIPAVAAILNLIWNAS